MEVEKQIREIIEFYCGGTYENRNTATKEILQICQNLQLQQTGVIKSVCSSELDCPFDFTSRCTMGRCDCKPKQTVL